MVKKFIAMLCCFISTIIAKETLIMGTASGYAPFVSLTPEGKYEGFDIDVSYEVAQKLRKKLVFKDCGSMPSLFLALKQGKVDAIIWAISITNEREQEMSLVHYQGEPEVTMPFIFWKTIPDNLEHIDDFAKNPKNVISVESGSSQDAIMRSYKEVTIKNVDKILDAVLDVKYGKSLAATIDPALIENMKKLNPGLVVKRFNLPKDLHVNGIGIGVNKANSELGDQISLAVEELKAEGVIDSLEKKWNIKK